MRQHRQTHERTQLSYHASNLKLSPMFVLLLLHVNVQVVCQGSGVHRYHLVLAS